RAAGVRYARRGKLLRRGVSQLPRGRDGGGRPHRGHRLTAARARAAPADAVADGGCGVLPDALRGGRARRAGPRRRGGGGREPVRYGLSGRLQASSGAIVDTRKGTLDAGPPSSCGPEDYWTVILPCMPR